MGWNRRLPPVAESPAPLSLARWLGAGGLALLIGVMLFLLAASERVPELKTVNVWLLCLAPIVLWLLAFAGRAYAYGGALSDQQFLEEEADVAQRAWSDWAQRYLSIKACCVVLPEQVSAAALMQRGSLPPSPPIAKRIAGLPADATERERAGLQMLIKALGPALAELPAKADLRVTLLSDAKPEHHERLELAWRQAWQGLAKRPEPARCSVFADFSYGEIEARLKAPDTAMELLLIIQLHGKDGYSDGLAALLFCPDAHGEAPSTAAAHVLRPMPLGREKLEDDLSMFLQTQSLARQAAGVLTERDACQPTVRTLLALASTHGGELKAENLWTQSALCGLPGPFTHWLTMALGVEMARHRQRPLLLLADEGAQGWIATVAAEVSA
ncbi:hypothetical protein ACA097_26750 [Pseudomonas sp. QL9]|uniref:hypothetical protein n=1 Tax=Pseudomonas sp. QL9 TaxID=3242725 RepID=UPI00352B58BE